MKMSSFTFLRQVWTHLIRPYWTSEDRWIALALLGGYLVLMGFFIAISVRLNYWNNEFFTALQELNSEAFFRLLGFFGVLAFFSILAYTCKFYLLQNLEIRWRKWMTTHLIDHWTHEQRYYALQLKGDGTDNPDQRIAEDVYGFIDKTLNLTLGLLSQFITLVSFLGILWSLSGTLTIPIAGFTLSIPGYMCWGALLYAIFGTCLSVYFGRPLIGLNYEYEKREANFRYSLVRFRENVDGIALYKGEEKEKKVFGERFGHIVENFHTIVKRMLIINSWNSFYGQVEHLFPFLLAAPRFFAKEITLGGLTQTMGAFHQVTSCLSFFVTNYVGIASWRATTNRLLEFKRNLEESPPSPILPTSHEKSEIRVSCESISLPHGGILKENVYLSFPKGVDSLIIGPTGTGKSTLARVIAGLWRYGKGSVTLPEESLMFLPQKPYMPLGTLEDVLRYPASKVSQQEFEQVLELVSLGDFKSRLHEVNDWARVLSMGEQQHIAIARALLTKPRWLVLDEATSAMNEASERFLYKLLKTNLPETTLISIGHRESLKGLHNRVISFENIEEPRKAVA